MGSRESAVSTPAPMIPVPAGTHAVELESTFEAVPDPFGLKTSANTESVALLVKLNGKEILRRTSTVEAGRTIRIDPLSGVIAGTNEIYLEAYPAIDATVPAHAMRIRVLQGGRAVADASFWSQRGSRIAGSFQFKIAEPSSSEDHAHGD